MQITETWLNLPDGTTLSTSVTDTGATNFNFDGMALRPQTAATSATNIVFNEVRVELVPDGTRAGHQHPAAGSTVFAGQNATFTVIAGGTGAVQLSMVLQR